ncbi:Tvp23 protein [Starmerella bacillaris]|uniref:Golgi apparatus membrane protein TVP23 n=1 Tax=Starmerella bacillaris TaxID=1247836 RepID=A0AAV5RH17_STABA|nr:Tvp23 protein [Starmerella bacillaris]
MSTSGDSAPQQQSASSEWSLLTRLRKSSHPVAGLSYILLRVAPLVVYVFGSWFVSNNVLIFIVVSLLLAADFWNVKNISGRLLVGLRWWNETATDGTSVWVFETADPQRYINPVDSRIFWVLLYAVPAVWGLFGFISILKLNILWFIAVLLALVLSLTNTFAFSRCDKFAKANNIIGSVSSSIFSRLFSAVGGRFFK